MLYRGADNINIENEELIILPEKAIFWKKERALFLSDPHFSKTAHFRKNGIAVPDTLDQSNYQVLDELIHRLNPEKLYILGDLFHSDYNNEMLLFRDWRKRHPDLKVFLTLGNHDKLDLYFYEQMGIIINESFEVGPFKLVHDQSQIQNQSNKYILNGHIHPAIRLRGKGKQSITLPCFRFSDSEGILPSFGAFTGTHVIKKKEKDTVFVVIESEIVKISKQI